MTRTEWGVESPWGTTAVDDRDTAERIRANMRTAGHQARIVWRAVSDWQEPDDD
jgi:hypothetical protein